MKLLVLISLFVLGSLARAQQDPNPQQPSQTTATTTMAHKNQAPSPSSSSSLLPQQPFIPLTTQGQTQGQGQDLSQGQGLGQGQGLDQGQGLGQGQGQQDALRLRCQTENGTVPYWLDNTCRAYLSCTNFNLSLQVCDPGRAYDYDSRSCVPENEVNCVVQNEEFTVIIQQLLAPHLYQQLPRPDLPLVPFVADNTVGPKHTDAQQEVEEGDDMYGLTIDVDDLPSILVDTSNAVNITLSTQTCGRLGQKLHQLETSMNMALLMLVGCPEQDCDVPVFKIYC